MESKHATEGEKWLEVGGGGKNSTQVNLGQRSTFTYRIVGLKISQGQTFICFYSLVFVIFKFWFVFWLFRIQLRKRLYDRLHTEYTDNE